MIAHRDATAAATYRAASRPERHEIAAMAVCDAENCMGLLRSFQATAWHDLARVRRMNGGTKLDRVRRKAAYFHVMGRIIERAALIAKNPLP